MSSGKPSRPWNVIADEIVKLEAQLRARREEHATAIKENARAKTEAQEKADREADEEFAKQPAPELRGPVPVEKEKEKEAEQKSA